MSTFCMPVAYAASSRGTHRGPSLVTHSRDLHVLGSDGKCPVSFHWKRPCYFHIPGILIFSKLQLIVSFLTNALLLPCSKKLLSSFEGYDSVIGATAFCN